MIRIVGGIEATRGLGARLVLIAGIRGDVNDSCSFFPFIIYVQKLELQFYKSYRMWYTDLREYSQDGGFYKEQVMKQMK